MLAWHGPEANGAELHWDVRQEEFEIAKDDPTLPTTVRGALAAMMVHCDDFCTWQGSKSRLGGAPDAIRDEWQLDAVIGPAEEHEMRVCIGLRALRAQAITEAEVLTEIAKCRAYYTERMAKGVPQHGGA